MLMASFAAACIMVVPSGTVSGSPSIVSVIFFFGAFCSASAEW
jgi:hypothetical protein